MKAGRLAAAACLGCAVAWGAAAAEPARPTVASINLCADQLLVHLADPAQIKGLSPYARDGVQSNVAAEAARLPVLSGTAEEILAAKPDLVLAGRYTKRATRDLLRARGLRLVELDPPRSLPEARRQIVEVARLLGQETRGAAVAAALDAATEAAARDAAAAPAPRTVLILQRRGWAVGGQSLAASLIRLVGLQPAGAARGAGGFVTLEAVVALRPDLLMVASLAPTAEDQGTALLLHPALAEAYPASRRIALPERLLNCGGPGLVEAIRLLSRQVSGLGAVSAGR